MTAPEQIDVWQQEATDLYQPLHQRLSFLRPKVLLKRGYFSPWCIPRAWFTATGAFNFLFWIYIAKLTLSCAPHRRKVIVAHECGHAREFHTLLLVFVGVVYYRFVDLPLIPEAVGAVAKATNIWIGFTVWAEIFLCLFVAGLWVYNWTEFQADDYAVKKVGAEEVIETLVWLRGPRPIKKKNPSQLDLRIARLQKLHGL